LEVPIRTARRHVLQLEVVGGEGHDAAHIHIHSMVGWNGGRSDGWRGKAVVGTARLLVSAGERHSLADDFLEAFHRQSVHDDISLERHRIETAGIGQSQRTLVRRLS